MINSKKKGFTIVELVIVIAVIAVLSAVLIPTFSNLVRKANISSDTVLAKNLNTALSLYEAENEVATFEDALEGIKEHGYLIANLNTKTSGCFFVWEKDTNQILLVDSKDEYKVLFSVRDGYGEPDESWHFAISNKDIAAQVKAGQPYVTIKQTVANMNDLQEILSVGGEVYIDESLVLNKENLLEFNKENITTVVNLGNAQLSTEGIMSNQVPINIKKGEVIINGGIIGALGSGVDLDGNSYSTPINSEDNTIVTINNTQFNGSGVSPIKFSGKATLNNVKLTGGYFYSYGNGNVTLNNGEVVCSDVAIWVTNTITHEDGTHTYDGLSTLTINGGKYESGITDENWGAVSVHDGTIIINEGEFKSAEGHMFGIIGTTKPEIIINGGTFNGVPFENLTVEILQKMTASGTVTKTDNGFKITK